MSCKANLESTAEHNLDVRYHSTYSSQKQAAGVTTPTDEEPGVVLVSELYRIIIGSVWFSGRASGSIFVGLQLSS
jgi:hypothetical protein